MEWDIREFLVTDLYLDQYNIRTPISDTDQNALIRDMFDNETAFDIAKSYVQNGLFPDEFPIGIIEDEKIIIIEGNRRLAALKALSEPNIVPTWQKKISSLGNPAINNIRIVVAPSRDAALKHIANKHTVDYRRPWKPLRQAYFYKSQIDNGKTIEELIAEFPDHVIPRFIKMLEMHHLAKSMNINDSLISIVHDDRNFPVTNLERFYDDRNVTNFLGIIFTNQGKVVGKVNPAEFSKGYSKIVEDVASGEIDSRKFNTVNERKKYIDGLPSNCVPDLDNKGFFTSENFTQEQTPKKIENIKKIGSVKSPKGLFYQKDVPFKISSTSLRLLYNELKVIDVGKFPNATHDLLRSFLECTLVFYLKETNQYDMVKKNQHHNPSLSDMLGFLSSDKCTTISDFNIIQVINQIKTDWGKSYSLERMNMINHNENWNSTEPEVRSAWGKIEGLIKILLNPKNQ